jgi:hypothetical protein
LQNKYGQGSNGEKQYIYNDDGEIVRMTGENSFGPLLDGEMDYTWNGTRIPTKLTETS